MADEADISQDRIDAERESSIALIRLTLKSTPVNTSGLCEDCDNPIGEARLQAQPTARRCIYCQKEYEKEWAR
jgi:DnaK suppressor protein